MFFRGGAPPIQSFAPIVTDTPLRATPFPSPVPLFVGRRLDRALLVTLVLAVLIHLPALPYASLFRGWLDPGDVGPEGDAIVPLDLDVTEVEVDDKPAPKLEPPKPEPKPEPQPEPKSEPPKLEPPKPEPKSEPEPEPTVAPPVEPKEEPVGQEIERELNGGQDNNVRVEFVSRELRKHPVGQGLGALLASHPQWEDFFKKNSLDPVKDLETIILTGPRFRVSDKVIAILEVGDFPKIESVVETLIQRGNGRWIEEAPVRAGITAAEGHQRVFALVPEKKLLYMIPSPFPSEKRKEQLKDKPEVLAKENAKAEAKVSAQLNRVKNGSQKKRAGVAIDAYMVQPWKLIGSKGKEGRIEIWPLGEIELIPRTLKRARIRVKVEPGGGATLSITAESESPEQAQKDAESLNALLPAARGAASLKLNLELPEFVFNVEGRSLVAKVLVPDAFLERVLALGTEAVETDRAIAAARAKKKD
jgi:hypothetical protein